MVSRPYGPALARLRLSSELRTLRGDRPAAGVANAMHWSLSKLNRIENSKVTIQPLEVRALAQHYGVGEPEEIERLVQLSLMSRKRMWWRDKNLPEDFLTFVSLEGDASYIYGYHATFIPPLLQTRAYAEAITSSVLLKPVDDEHVQQVVEIRMKRQEVLRDRLAGDHPPKLHQAIDEAVLLRPVGGIETMRNQLDHLLKMATSATVQIVVILIRSGGHPGLGGVFELLSFSEADDLDVAFIETSGDDFLLTDKENTSRFREIMDSLLKTDPKHTSLARAVENAREWHGLTT